MIEPTIRIIVEGPSSDREFEIPRDCEEVEISVDTWRVYVEVDGEEVIDE